MGYPVVSFMCFKVTPEKLFGDLSEGVDRCLVLRFAACSGSSFPLERSSLQDLAVSFKNTKARASALFLDRKVLQFHSASGVLVAC